MTPDQVAGEIQGATYHLPRPAWRPLVADQVAHDLPYAGFTSEHPQVVRLPRFLNCSVRQLLAGSNRATAEKNDVRA